MRANELLASRVVDERGTYVGQVRDIRVSGSDYSVVGLAVGDGWRSRIAHRWGYAEGRAQGPTLLRALLRPAVERTLYVPADRVSEWRPGVVRLRGSGDDLPRFSEVLGR